MTAKTGKAALRFAALATLALGAGAATEKAAQAQAVSEAARKPFAIKLGVYMPSVKEVREFSGVFNFSIEGDVVIQRFPEISSQSIFSIGYIEREGLRLIPVTVSQIFRDPNNPSGRDYYYGFGLGVYSTRLDAPDTTGRIKNLPGAFLVTGLDINEKLLVEVKYHILYRYDRKNVNGLQISLGRRF